MKSILSSLFSILLTVLIIICIVRGISIGQFQILSIADIKANSSKLDSEIEELNNLKNVTYKQKLDALQSSIKNLTTAKQNYLDLASVSTDTEIKQANQEQTYAMEFLWNKIGSYATQEGIELTWNVVSVGNDKYTLNFTISGSYIGIINYIYTLENDSELAFKIENFKISSGGGSNGGNSSSKSGGSQVTATFSVPSISIKSETITSSTAGSSSMSTNTNTNTSTNTTNTTSGATKNGDTASDIISQY